MTHLDPEWRELIDRARGAEDPEDGVRERVHGRVAAQIAAVGGAAATTAVTAGAKAAALGLWGKLLIVGGLGVAISVVALDRGSADHEPLEASLATVASARGSEALPIDEGGGEEILDAASSDRLVPERSAPPGDGVPDPHTSPSPNAPRGSTEASASAADHDLASETTAAPTDGLAAEVAVLRIARSKLNGGDAAGALAALNDYERERPAGALGQERAVVRVLALCQLGRTEEARHAGELLIRLAPDSPTAKRLRGTCAVAR